MVLYIMYHIIYKQSTKTFVASSYFMNICRFLVF